jgi:2'-5' RNA ligase
MTVTRLQPLVLTLQLDAISFAIFDDLRRRHFAPERNLVPAHITLFHALPGAEKRELVVALQRVSSQTPILDLSFPGVRFLGQGVAIEVQSPGLLALRKRLASQWRRWLVAQDKQSYQPHITIQNKVSGSQARCLFERLRATWEPRPGKGEGLQLWHYRGGPWALVADFPFGKSDSPR